MCPGPLACAIKAACSICVPPSLSAAMLNVSNSPITRVPLVIATTTAFFAVILHWLTSLHLHVFESVRRSLPLLNTTSPDIQPDASYQAPSCALGCIFGLVRLRDPLRLTSALLVPGGMQPILLGRTLPGVDRRHWGVRMPHDRWVARARRRWAVGGESGLELMNQVGIASPGKNRQM